MPDSGMGLNLARIVHRVLTSPRGWNRDELMKELAIQPRTYRKYRQILTEEFLPFIDAGESLLQEVREDATFFLRLNAGRVSDAMMPRHVDRITAMHLARQLMGFLEKTRLGREVDETLRELLTRVPNGSVFSSKLRNAGRLFYHKPFGAKDYGRQSEELSTILNALVFHAELEIVYRSAYRQNEVTTRIVEPLTLVSYREGLYLLAQISDAEEKRIFAVDRIVQVQRTGSHFPYPSEEEFHPERYFANAFGLYRAHPPQRRVVELIFVDKPWLISDLTERTWDVTQKFTRMRDGRLRLTFRPESLVEVRAWIASFGDNVEVVRPAPLDDPIWFATPFAE
jgi:predicted DNA-binding transcriptional regulator YafY